MSPRLHNHDTMTIVELFFMSVPFFYNMSCNVGALKIVQLSAVLCLTPRIAVKVRVRARARGWRFFFCLC